MKKTLTAQTERFFPADWPKEGPIDLKIHDLPHASSTTEWWYMHTHIQAKNGRNFSLFASFFRRVIDYDKKTKAPIHGHSVIWGISDLDNETYETVSLIDKRAPKMGLKRLERGEIVKDPFLKRAAAEMLRKGVVPYPDELLKKEARVSLTKLDLNYDDNTFVKLNNGAYKLHLQHEDLKISADLVFTPQKAPVRHGDDGVVRGVSAEDMFYYFIPRCKVMGSIKIKEDKFNIESASGWYDHEFGCHPDKKDDQGKKEVSWNWIGIQLDNGCEITAYELVNLKTKEDCGSFVILVDEKGKRHYSTDFHFHPIEELWTSTRTFNDYPVVWKLEAPAFKIALEVRAAFPNQEFATVLSKPAFWEGRMNISGTFRNKKVTGKGYIERHGFMNSLNMRDFLKAVSRQTLKSVRKIIPTHFDQEKFEELVSVKGNTHFISGLDKKAYTDTMIKPIRTMTDRGGKTWRSYATVACCDIVGGNSQKAIDWLALPELMHVGSLIVDDVEDGSLVRRGGPACHLIYGTPVAINAGTASYFLGQICIYRAKDGTEKKIQIYNWYFEAMRASHSGQAMDIYGLDYMIPAALENDTTARLLAKRVIATHRLKSAAPASYLAKIGALIGDGTPEQINGLGDYFESLGIAFQIIDDTLNLKGFKDNLKTKAEDLSAGKITYPVARAMSVLSKPDRKRLWEIVSSKTGNIEVLAEAVALMDKHQVIENCEKEAKNRLERAWKKLDPLVRDSMVKLNLRAFSWFVLERTY